MDDNIVGNVAQIEHLNGNIAQVDDYLSGNISQLDYLSGNLNSRGDEETVYRGYSAYEIALQQGFEGSKDEWLRALVGPQGEIGVSISDVRLNDDFTLTITLDDGTEFITGPIKGDKGDKGQKGDKGDTGKGISFVRLNDDYTLSVIFSDNSDYQTHIPIRGEKGQQGIQGVQGPKGDTGERGPQGQQGIQGEQGPRGQTGPRGQVGPKGETGAAFTYEDFTPEQLELLRGPQGQIGPKGDTGQKGEKGDIGAQGIQGESGEDALSVEITNPLAIIPVGSDGYTTKQVTIAPIISAYKGRTKVDYNLVIADGVTVLTREGVMWDIPPYVDTGKNHPPYWTIPVDRRFWSNTGTLSITVTSEGQTINLSYGYAVVKDGEQGVQGIQGEQGIQGIQGEKGDKGDKGDPGQPGTNMEIHICSIIEYDNQTRMPTIENPNSSTFYLVPTSDATSPDLFTEWVYVNNAWEMFGSMKIDLGGYLTDVKVGGNSVVSDGVAEIPMADYNVLGAVKINPSKGIGILNGELLINGANASDVKNGNTSTKAVNAYRQHESTFYGLAKAAGHDEKDSELPVGQYTDEAKSSIQNMLGITDKYSPKEWVAESETELVTNAHSKGDLFYIGEILYKVIVDLNAGDAINVGVNVEEVNVNDILDDYATKEDVQDNVSIVEKSASGAVVSFDDGMDDMPLKSLTVDIELAQDLHGYDSPWVGGGGKNLLEVSEANIEKPSYYPGTWEGTTIADAKENSITVSRTNGQGGFAGVVIPNGLKAGTYTFSCDVPVTANSKSFYIGYAENGVFAGQKALMGAGASQTHPNKSFTLENDTDSFYIKMAGVIDDAPLTFSHLQIEMGDTATAWTPYENICPISGWTKVDVEQSGKNLLNKNAITWTSGLRDDDGNIVPSGSHFTNAIFGFEPNMKYKIQGTIKTTGTARLYFLTADEQWIERTASIYNSPYTFTTPSNCRAIQVQVTTDITNLDDVQIELGSTATDYKPYTGRSIPINFGQTVYGGKLDVLRGVMSVEMAILDMGSLVWTYNNTSFAYGFFAGTVVNKKVGSSNLYCSQYKTIHGGRNMLTTNATISPYNTTNSNSVCVRDDAYTDAMAFKTAMSGVQLVYELTEPIEIQLTPHEVNSLLGVNNIFADTGNTSVEYFSQVDKDLIDYIETSLKPYAKEEKLNDYVSDVQVNGNSIVENNVANVPIATQNVIGALYTASEADGKVGTHTYRAIVPKVQHSSVFYGLAKAAGVDMASSSNAIGIYTESAKSAISDMLNGAIQISGTDPTINAKSGIRYVCGEVLSLNITVPSIGIIDVVFTSGSSPTVLTITPPTGMTMKWINNFDPATLEANTTYEINIMDGYLGVVGKWT